MKFVRKLRTGTNRTTVRHPQGISERGSAIHRGGLNTKFAFCVGFHLWTHQPKSLLHGHGRDTVCIDVIHILLKFFRSGSVLVYLVIYLMKHEDEPGVVLQRRLGP